jgi:hypothetical protein
MAEVEDFLGIFEDAVSEDECQEIITLYEYMDKIGTTYTRQSHEGISKIHKEGSLYFTTQSFDPVFMENNVRAIRPFCDALWRCYEKYVDKYGVIPSLGAHRISETIQIQKTGPGEGYHVWHCEAGSVATGRRLFVAILYLNDVEEGGETELLYQRKRIPPKRGTIILCPASFTHTHRGNPPLSGNKYIVTTWIEFCTA